MIRSAVPVSSFITVASLLLSAGLPRTASAYALHEVCNGEEQPVYDNGQLPDDPACRIVRWKTGCTGFAIQKDGGAGIDATTLDSYMNEAVNAWLTADCGKGLTPGLFATDMGEVECNKVEYNSDAGNANIIMVRTDAWPHPPEAGHDIALTTTTFDPQTGELFNADMELNAFEFELTTGDDNVQYDLLSVLTHETGHFFGLAHSTIQSATMRPTYNAGDVDMRTLATDDREAICNLYPPNPAITRDCNPLPRHGFSPQCAVSQTEGTCSVSNVGQSTGWLSGLGLAALGALSFQRRRRRTAS